MKLLYLLIHIGKVPNFSIIERPAGELEMLLYDTRKARTSEYIVAKVKHICVCKSSDPIGFGME